MFRYRRLIYLINIIIFSFLILKLFKFKWNNSFNNCIKNNLILNKDYYSNLIYIPELNLLYCDIPKAASTNLRRFFYVYLNQSKSFENLDRKKIWLDYKNFFNKYYLTKNNSELILKNKNIFKFLIVRHPFQRIYSVYNDKFVNNQLDDTIFGWKQLEENILLEIQTNETLLTIRRNDLKLNLRTFLLYIIKTIKNKQIINSHWEQIVHRCAFCFINYNWIGKIENFHYDQNFLIKKFQMKNFQFPSNQLDKKEKKYLLLNDYQLFQLFRNTIQNDQDFQILIDYYKHDFQLFNYYLPNL